MAQRNDFNLIYFFLGSAIVAMGVGMYCYNQEVWLPRDVHRALNEFRIEGNPRPLAMLGDRAEPAVPALTRMVRDSKSLEQYTNASVLLGIIGGVRAENALLQEMDTLEAGNRSRQRSSRSAPIVLSLAMINSRRGATRILTFQIPSAEEKRILIYPACLFHFPPDDPGLWIDAFSTEKAFLTPTVVWNTLELIDNVSDSKRWTESEALANTLLAHRHDFEHLGDRERGMDYPLPELMSVFHTAAAQAYVEQVREKYKVYFWFSERKRYRLTSDPDSILNALRSGGRPPWDTSETGEKDDSNIAFSGELNDIHLGDTAPDWVYLYLLPKLSKADTPFLISCLRAGNLSQNKFLEWSFSPSFPFSEKELTANFHLRRTTGQNFGLDADAWQAWWESQKPTPPLTPPSPGSPAASAAPETPARPPTP